MPAAIGNHNGRWFTPENASEMGKRGRAEQMRRSIDRKAMEAALAEALAECKSGGGADKLATMMANLTAKAANGDLRAIKIVFDAFGLNKVALTSGGSDNAFRVVVGTQEEADGIRDMVDNICGK